MGVPAEQVNLERRSNPFDLRDEASYQRWRAGKLASRARCVEDLIVDVADAAALGVAEREALLQRLARWNMALYRSPSAAPDKAIARAIGAQLGLHRLDANWLADEDGVSSITIRGSLPPTLLRNGPPEGERPAWGGPAPGGHDGRGGFIPYTDRAIKWHTDGYYHPAGRCIRAMVLHCVRPARSGGVNALLDHELAYIALRDASPVWIRALMAPDAMTIPSREGEAGVEREAQSGPVFSVDPKDGALHMRYTARTRSIEWKADAATHEAAAFLDRFLSHDNPHVLRVRLDAGMGIVAHNVLHDRSGFVDHPQQPRLLYRARYLDRACSPEVPWRNG
jgi:Taurine catabolism dioxygenase TauD, TfdA family